MQSDFGMLAADADLSPEEARRAWRDARRDHADHEVEGGLLAVMRQAEKEIERLPAKKDRARFRQNSRRHRQRSGRVKMRQEAARAKMHLGRRR